MLGNILNKEDECIALVILIMEFFIFYFKTKETPNGVVDKESIKAMLIIAVVCIIQISIFESFFISLYLFGFLIFVMFL